MKSRLETDCFKIERLKEIGKNSNDLSSVLLVTSNDDVYSKSDVPIKVLEILGISKILLNILRTTFPRPLRDSFYDVVANNRYNFLGKREECRCSDPNDPNRFVNFSEADFTPTEKR